MCIIFLNASPLHNIKLIVAFNRDEVKNRPSRPARYWAEPGCSDQAIFGGQDGSSGGVPGGSWLAVSKSTARLGALLNVHHLARGMVYSPEKAPRGGLVPGFLRSEDPEGYITTIRDGGYNYFNLVLVEFEGPAPRLRIYDYYNDSLTELDVGAHCFGNLPPHSHNPRTNFGMAKFTELLEKFKSEDFKDTATQKEYLTEALFNMLSDRTEIELPAGLSGSFRHIYNEGYQASSGTQSGSVSSTVFIVDTNNQCVFRERSNFKDVDSMSMTEFQVGYNSL